MLLAIIPVIASNGQENALIDAPFSRCGSWRDVGSTSPPLAGWRVVPAWHGMARSTLGCAGESSGESLPGALEKQPRQPQERRRSFASTRRACAFSGRWRWRHPPRRSTPARRRMPSSRGHKTCGDWTCERAFVERSGRRAVVRPGIPRRLAGRPRRCARCGRGARPPRACPRTGRDRAPEYDADACEHSAGRHTKHSSGLRSNTRITPLLRHPHYGRRLHRSRRHLQHAHHQAYFFSLSERSVLQLCAT